MNNEELKRKAEELNEELKALGLPSIPGEPLAEGFPLYGSCNFGEDSGNPDALEEREELEELRFVFFFLTIFCCNSRI